MTIPLNSFEAIASDVLKIAGDDLESQYLRSICMYAFSISLLYPPPEGGLPNLKASKIVSVARTIAAARLFDYRAFGLYNVRLKTPLQIGDIRIPRMGLRSKDLFQDPIAMLLFRRNLFHPRRGITSLLSPVNSENSVAFEIVEKGFKKRIDEMDAMADIINIYFLCEPEIRKRSRSNGIDVVVNLYLKALPDKETDDNTPSARTLENNWKRLKPAAIFHYLHNYQGRNHSVFSTPLGEFR